VVQLLKACGIQEFVAVDVLADPEIREGIKAYSNWPTVPQLYIKGEFVGGADIVRDMHSQGELQKLLDSALDG
jgi:monothiol glutaredoxin